MQYTLDCADWASCQNPGWDAYLAYSPGLPMWVVVQRAAPFPHCRMGLLGLCGSVVLPLFPAGAALGRRACSVPAIWYTWWTMGVSGPLRWQRLAGCTLAVVGSSLWVGDGERSLDDLSFWDVISLRVPLPPYTLPISFPGVSRSGRDIWRLAPWGKRGFTVLQVNLPCWFCQVQPGFKAWFLFSPGEKRAHHDSLLFLVWAWETPSWSPYSFNVWTHSVVSDSLWPHGLWPTRFLCPWDSLDKKAGACCHFLLQFI